MPTAEFQPATGAGGSGSPGPLARRLCVTIAAFGLLSLVTAGALAADPEPNVRVRTPSPPTPAPGPPAPAPAPDKAAPEGRDRGSDDARNPNDHGGVGPNTRHKNAKADDGEVTREFKEGTPLGVVRAAFRCALEMDESSGFDCYMPLNIENNRNNENARTHLRRYQWAHFRKWATTYPLPGKEFALRQTRQVPAKLDAETQEIKFYFVSRNRDNPAPVTLRREGGAWLIYANSL